MAPKNETMDTPKPRAPHRSLLLLFASAAGLIGLLLIAPSHDAATGIGSGGLAGILGFGFLLGLRHALDADHLVAVGTMLSGRAGAREAAMISGMWGLGHTVALLIAGIVVVLLRPRIPPIVSPILEACVAAMILALGVNLLLTARRRGGVRVHGHRHSHGTLEHWHPHVHFGDEPEPEPANHHPIRSARRPFLVGMIHGLAGSATLVILVVAEIRNPVTGMVYLGVFGIGSMIGMVTLGLAFALPYAMLRRRFGGIERRLRLAAAAASIAFALLMIYRIGFGGGGM